jgi:hypothetical protein
MPMTQLADELLRQSLQEEVNPTSLMCLREVPPPGSIYSEPSAA